MSQQSNLRLPDMKRDSTWLASADLFSVFLALVGQVILTRSLLSSDYGLFIILLDYQLYWQEMEAKHLIWYGHQYGEFMECN